MSGNRLFVTKSDVFPLVVLYTKEGELKVSRETDVEEEEKSKWEKFEIQFMVPDFGMAKSIVRMSTDFEKGSNVLSASLFTDNLLKGLAKSWNLKDEDGKDIPLDFQKLNELRPDITRLFVELLQEKLSKDGLYEAILLS